MRIASVCVVKNAERRIAEWIAYQFAVGFDSVIMLDNMSTDSTVDVIKKFQGRYDVRLIDWPMIGVAYQRFGYEYACWFYRHEFDWCACIDADEFIVPPANQSVSDMMSKFGDSTAAVALPWAMFGSSGLVERPEGLVIDAYLHRAEADFDANRHIKSVVRPNRVLQCMSPHHFRVDGSYATNAGEEMGSSPLTDRPLNFVHGRINHYFVQSKTCWTEKINRGYNDTVRNPDEFYINDRNEVFDDTITSNISAVNSILAKLDLI